MAEQKGSKEEEHYKKTLDYAIESDEVAKIYANGFSNFLNNADVGLVLQVNGKPKAVVNMSYTLAKTLYKKLGKMIDQFETESKHEIMDTDFITQTLEGKRTKSS